MNAACSSAWLPSKVDDPARRLGRGEVEDASARSSMVASPRDVAVAEDAGASARRSSGARTRTKKAALGLDSTEQLRCRG